MKRPDQSKTCPRCKGRGYLPRLTAARSDGACCACAGAGWVLIGGALRDFKIASFEKWLSELDARGRALAARKAVDDGWWFDHDERALTTLRGQYRATRRAILALRALPDDAKMGAIHAAEALADT